MSFRRSRGESPSASFRTRIFLALLLAVLLPLGGLAVGVRREVSTRLAAEYRQRVDALVQVIRDDIAQEGHAVAERLDALADALARDNQFRLAAVQRDPSARRYLLDYAGPAMRLAGLTMLQVQDSAGRILSSGHFRNAYDQSQPELLHLLGAADSAVLVRTRNAEAPLLALARIDTFYVAGRPFMLVGGVAVGGRWLRGLERDGQLEVTLVIPSATTAAVPDLSRVIGQAAPDSGRVVGEAAPESGRVVGKAARDFGRIVGEFALPYIDVSGDGPVHPETARILVTQSLGTLQAIQRGTDRWFLGALAATAVFAVIAAGWLASRVSRPLRELAGKTSAIDLDRLDADFTTDRTDEIGTLSHMLDTMVARLRRSSAHLREAERRAAVGDLARQVNHDVKNGLTPIRHVLRHLSQVARDDPAALAAVFEERRGTLESSVSYLETLARNYAKLTPQLAAGRCDVNAAVRGIVEGIAGRPEVHTALADDLPPALADEVALRRILENLIGNAVDSLDTAVDSLDGQPGSTAVTESATVTVSTERAGDTTRPLVRITVTDTGRGMTRAELDRAFEDFYTTKDTGTGLGLSIVRRLVLDLGGALRVETEPGTGTRVCVELPT